MNPSLLDRIVYVRPDQLRASWRILLFLGAGIAASNLVVPLIKTWLPESSIPWLSATLECLAVLVATRYAVKSLDGESWEAVGLGRASWSIRSLLPAALSGALAIAIPTGLLVAHGDLTFVSAPADHGVRALLLSAAMLAPAALTEELLFRGYPFTVLRETRGWAAATAVTSVMFGLLHLRNPGANVLAIVNVVAAGVFLAGIRVVTGSLAAAWAAHFAWNWTMSAGFHTAVSGLAGSATDYALVDTGPEWLSGGVWGPEGGALAAVGMTASFAGLWWVTGRNRRAGSVPAASVSLSMNAGRPSGAREHEA